MPLIKDPKKEQKLAEELGLTDARPKSKHKTDDKGEVMETKEKGHASSTDVHDQAEAELKRKGLKTMDQLNDYSTFTPITLDDQKYLHANDIDAWKEVHENIRDRKKDALEKARQIDLQKQEEELKLLKVKRYDEAKAKPEFLCVVNGCGEEKAPGQGYHCASHSKGS